ncbi:MAG: YlbF family regulator [Paenibacillaceae bacterium]
MSQPQHNDHCAVPTFTSTEVIVREDIMMKAKELAESLSTADEVQVYQKAELKVNNHTEVQNIIKVIKKKQKEIVGFEHFKNEAMVAKIEKEIEELEGQLNEYPVVNEFKQSQEDINYLLQLVIGIIRDTVSEKIAIDTNTVVSTSNCAE